MSDFSKFFGGPFDPSTVKPAEDFEVIPPGKHTALIIESEVKVTKKGTGRYIYLKMQIVDGQYRDRPLFDQINIQNPNTQCVEIGLRSLSALARALELAHVEDTDQLLNRVVVAHVKVKDGQNSIRTYSAAEYQQPASTAVTQAVPVAPVAAAAAPTTVAPAVPVSHLAPAPVQTQAPGPTYSPGSAPAPVAGPVGTSAPMQAPTTAQAAPQQAAPFISTPVTNPSPYAPVTAPVGPPVPPWLQ